MKDIMLDLETLGTRHDAMIIQIGACYFDRETGEIGRAFSVNIDPKGYEDKFTIDYGTIAWWFQQSDAARRAVMGNTLSLEEALRILGDFFFDPSDVCIWSHATFDMPILANAFNIVGIKNRLPFRNARDIRTLMDLAGPSAPMSRDGIHHNALDDCKYQVEYCVQAMQKLKHGTHRF